MSTLSLWWCNDSSSQVWFSAFSMLPSKKMCWTCHQKQIEISWNLNATQSKKMGKKKKLYRRPCLFLSFQITNSHQLNNDLTQSTSDYPLTPHTMGCLTMPLSQRDPPTATCPHRCHGHVRPKTSRHGRGTRARLEMSRGNVKQWVSQGSTKGWRVWRTSLDIWYL